jgi:hypothetical protein
LLKAEQPFGSNICSHGLSDFFVHLTVCSTQSNDLKIKIQKLKFHELLALLSSIFIYKKKDEKQRSTWLADGDF